MLALIQVLCQADPSALTAVVNGVIAAATALGGCTAFGAGLPAAAYAFNRSDSAERADQINRGLGAGFLFGVAAALVMLIVFSARIVS